MHLHVHHWSKGLAAWPRAPRIATASVLYHHQYPHWTLVQSAHRGHASFVYYGLGNSRRVSTKPRPAYYSTTHYNAQRTLAPFTVYPHNDPSASTCPEPSRLDTVLPSDLPNRQDLPDDISTLVCSVDVDSLSACDMDDHPARASSSVYIAPSLYRGEDLVPARYWDLRPLYPFHPRTSSDLYQRLLWEAHSLPSLHRLVEFARLYSYLASTRSYNFLISLSIRLGDIRSAARLFKEMAQMGIHQDHETEVLLIRSMVRSGDWVDAWRMVCYRVDQERRHMPVHIWIEFFRSAYTTRPTNGGDLNGAQENRPPSVSRYATLMSRLPLFSATFNPLMPQIAYFFVQTLLDFGMQHHAVSLTHHLLASLSSSPSGRTQSVCRKIIHLHLRYRYRGAHALRKSLQLATSFHAVNPSIAPDSSTVYCILLNLKRTGRCGTRAKRLLLLLQRHWGSHVEDERVRRLIVFLAIREKREDLVLWGWRKQDLLHSSRKLRELEAEVLGPEWHVPRLIEPRPSWAALLPNVGAERRKWLQLPE